MLLWLDPSLLLLDPCKAPSMKSPEAEDGVGMVKDWGQGAATTLATASCAFASRAPSPSIRSRCRRVLSLGRWFSEPVPHVSGTAAESVDQANEISKALPMIQTNTAPVIAQADCGVEISSGGTMQSAVAAPCNGTTAKKVNLKSKKLVRYPVQTTIVRFTKAREESQT